MPTRRGQRGFTVISAGRRRMQTRTVTAVEVVGERQAPPKRAANKETEKDKGERERRERDRSESSFRANESVPWHCFSAARHLTPLCVSVASRSGSVTSLSRLFFASRSSVLPLSGCFFPLHAPRDSCATRSLGRQRPRALTPVWRRLGERKKPSEIGGRKLDRSRRRWSDSEPLP